MPSVSAVLVLTCAGVVVFALRGRLLGWPVQFVAAVTVLAGGLLGGPGLVDASYLLRRCRRI